MPTPEERLQDIERLLGAKIPEPSRAWLIEKRPEAELTIDLEGETISFFYEVSDGYDYCQLDDTYRLVHDVLPPYTLPIATDAFGNFYCLVVAGDQSGSIVWWDHERDLGDFHVDKIASSLREFLQMVKAGG